ncbi:hypothetical protein O181_080529 [Austropuccinia psidii MF-1]|uniref:Uncharacterized protein n=1 Tax=Austropuccinia psidii MF-1 TaxID=1389203 RepID=A0A9Q3FL35_9BASI|nr:hypothetical protein [Austropuccinia psidii MF-1]
MMSWLWDVMSARQEDKSVKGESIFSNFKRQAANESSETAAEKLMMLKSESYVLQFESESVKAMQALRGTEDPPLEDLGVEGAVRWADGLPGQRHVTGHSMWCMVWTLEL